MSYTFSFHGKKKKKPLHLKITFTPPLFSRYFMFLKMQRLVKRFILILNSFDESLIFRATRSLFSVSLFITFKIPCSRQDGRSLKFHQSSISKLGFHRKSLHPFISLGRRKKSVFNCKKRRGKKKKSFRVFVAAGGRKGEKKLLIPHSVECSVKLEEDRCKGDLKNQHKKGSKYT